jgi:hypothetical protein
MEIKNWILVFVRILLLVIFVFLISGVLWKVFDEDKELETEEVNISESKLDLKIENVLVEEDNLIIEVKREGFGDLKGVKFIFEDENASFTFERFTSIENLGSQMFSFNLSELNLGLIKSIRIIPLVENFGEEKREENFTDVIYSEKINLGSGSKFIKVFEEVNESEEIEEVEEESSSSSGRGSSSSSSSSSEEISLEDGINKSFYWFNTIAIYEDIGGKNKTPTEIKEYINSNYEVENISRDLILTSAETYLSKKGREQDLLRVIFQIFYLHKEYNSMILIYESSNYTNETTYVLNFGGNNSNSGYFYFENGTLEFGEKPMSFWDLIDKEEARRNILIDRFGIFYEGDLLSYNNLTIEDVMEWTEL